MATVLREMMALKAAVDPMLMSASAMETRQEKVTALTGMWSVGWSCARSVLCEWVSMLFVKGN